MRALLPALLTLALAGCTRSSPVPATGDELPEPPSGSGIRSDDGEQRTLFRPVGFIAYGEQREGDLPDPQALVGYEFEAEFDPGAEDPARQTVTVRATLSAGGAELGLALYGPRTRDGLWEARLAHRRGDGRVEIEHTLAKSGLYFLLVQGRAGDQSSYQLSLECAGGACEAPRCPDLEPCDRVCADGYDFDADGCRLCACIEAVECQAGDCPEGERCVEGACQPDEESCAERCPAVLEQVCGGDGRTYPNPCIAACEGVEVERAGRCPEVEPECGAGRACPEGEACDEGRCVPRGCTCDDVPVAPVCGESGRSYRHLCALECTDDDLAYEGQCVERRCEDVTDCPRDWRCLPSPDVPGNRQRCADMDDPDCIRACVPPSVQRCNEDHPCPDNQVCYGNDAGGLCTARCRLDGGQCPRGAVCAAIDPAEARQGAGICLPGCARAPADFCRPLLCLPDLRGEPVCRFCDCADAEPQPVCAEGRPFASPCHARCAGFEEFERGPCEDCSRCPPERDPVCGADGVFYASRCEANCNGVRIDRPATCLGDEPIRFACRVDDDCARTGCEGRICASSPTRFCPEMSELAQCVAEAGACGCVENICRFTRTRATAACFERDGDGEGEGDGDMPPDDEERPDDVPPDRGG